MPQRASMVLMLIDERENIEYMSVIRHTGELTLSQSILRDCGYFLSNTLYLVQC